MEVHITQVPSVPHFEPSFPVPRAPHHGAHRDRPVQLLTRTDSTWLSAAFLTSFSHCFSIK